MKLDIFTLGCDFYLQNKAQQEEPLMLSNMPQSTAHYMEKTLTYTAVGSAKYGQLIAKYIACDDHLLKYDVIKRK